MESSIKMMVERPTGCIRLKSVISPVYSSGVVGAGSASVELFEESIRKRIRDEKSLEESEIGQDAYDEEGVPGGSRKRSIDFYKLFTMIEKCDQREMETYYDKENEDVLDKITGDTSVHISTKTSDNDPNTNTGTRVCALPSSVIGAPKGNLAIGDEISREKEFCLLPMDFFLTALQNDMRVRWYRREGTDIIVKFWSVDDAISYYRQYARLADVRFVETELWESLDNPTSRNRERPLKRSVAAEKPVKLVSNAARKTAFLFKVEYFEERKNYFSKEDVKMLEERFRIRNYELLYEKSKEIACGCSSNLVMQNVVKQLTEEELCTLIMAIGEDISALAASKHGAYAIQSIISHSLSPRSRGLISENIRYYGEFLFCHEIGNYTIQKVMTFDSDTVCSLCISNLSEIVESKLGIKVLKRSLPFFQARYDEIRTALNLISSPENRSVCKNLFSIMGSE